MRLRSTLNGAAAIALGAGLSWGGGATPAGAESLADALVRAYQTSPELASQRASVKVASETASIARAGNRPTIVGTGNLSVRSQRFEPFNLPSTFNLSVVQNLYTGGQVENTTTAAETRIVEAEAVLTDVEQAVLLSATIAYLDVSRDQGLLRVSRNNVRVLSEQLEAAEERFEVGEVTRTDVEQARARLAASRSDLAAALGSLEISRDAYRRAIGQDPGKLDPVPPLPDLPEDEQDAVSIALQNDPTIQAARIEREASGFDVKAAIGALLPQVTLEGTASRAVTALDGTNGDGFRDASLGLFVTIPIFTGGANYASVRQAQAAVEGAEADITTSIRDARQAVGIAWSQIAVARAQIRAGQLEVRAAELAFEGVREEAKVGARTTLDVLDAEQETLEARADLITAQRDEYVAAYQLLEAMGLLTVSHLGLDVGQLRGEKSYYDTVRERAFGYDQTDDTVWTLDWRP